MSARTAGLIFAAASIAATMILTCIINAMSLKQTGSLTKIAAISATISVSWMSLLRKKQMNLLKLLEKNWMLFLNLKKQSKVNF